MHSLYNSKNHGHQVLSPSSRCALNCQGLSIHLPPLGQGRDSVPDNDYISPPMSASWDRSKFDESSYHRSNGHRTYSVTPPSRPSTSSHPSVSGKLSPTTRTIHTNRLGKDVHGGLSTPNSTDRETSGTSLGMSSDGHARESNDEVSSNAHDSPEAQLISGPPGIARRAKAHVPSACVNCKKKHLACETKRPCSRCVQTGKEVSQTWNVSKPSSMLMSPSLAASMFSTRSEVGLGFGKKTTFGKGLLGVNILIRSYTRILPLV